MNSPLDPIPGKVPVSPHHSKTPGVGESSSAPLTDQEESEFRFQIQKATHSQTLPRDWQDRMKILARDAASRTRGDMASGLSWGQIPHPDPTKPIDSIMDPMAAWQEDEARSISFREKLRRTHQRMMVASTGFALLAVLASLAVMELPAGLDQQPAIAQARETIRGWVGLGNHPVWPATPKADRAVADLQAPISDPDSEAVEILVVLNQVAGDSGRQSTRIESVAHSADQYTASQNHRMVTSARFAENLARTLEPWQDLNEAANRSAYNNSRLSGHLAVSNGTSSAWSGQEIRCYRPPNNVAARALREALESEYPQGTPIILPGTGEPMAEVIVRNMARVTPE